MKLFFLILLIVHSIGHLQGVFVALGLRDFGSWNAESKILSSLSIRIQRILCLILYLISSILFLVAALKFWKIELIEYSWEWLAIVGAIISYFSMILFPKAFAKSFNTIGAIAVNALIFYLYFVSDQWINF